mmetsp:Transcript_52308/g.97932  ORF Transcript_52308/g.97932 Transcript_52308/m.97932 type:complete len:362 (-) Transcript_52308:852-1937(-)
MMWLVCDLKISRVDTGRVPACGSWSRHVPATARSGSACLFGSRLSVLLGPRRLGCSLISCVVGLHVHAGNSAARCVGPALKCLVPLQRHLARASNGVLPAHCSGRSRILPKVLGEELSEHVCLFGSRRFDWKPMRCCCHLLVGNDFFGMGLDGVDPAVPDAIAELLLLTPKDFLRQVSSVTRQLEGLSQDPLLTARIASLIFAHLLNRVEAHSNLHEFPVQERHSGLDAPSHHSFVRSQAVVQVQLFDLSAVLCVKLLWIRSFVEVEVASKNLICTFATQDHLHTRSPDPASHQVHGGGGTYGGHIKRLQVVDDVRKGIQGFFNCEDILVMHGSQEGSHFFGSFQIWAAFQASAERVQLRP